MSQGIGCGVRSCKFHSDSDECNLTTIEIGTYGQCTKKEVKDSVLDTKLLVRQETRIARLLPPATKQKASIVVQAFKSHVFSPDTDLYKVIATAVRSHFSNLSATEVKVLAFYVLSKAVRESDEDLKVVLVEIEAWMEQWPRVYDLSGNEGITVQDLKSLLYDLKGVLDGMNEMKEMTSLRLQMTMDRRSKFISTLSQMMKKIATTQDMLIQNLK